MASTRRDVLAGIAAGPLVKTGRSAANTTIALDGYSIRATDFGARFDGATDDSAAIQEAIDAAHARGGIVLFPAGVAMLAHPINLAGRNVSLSGAGVTQTYLRAARRIPTLISAMETIDVIVSPLRLADFCVDGSGLADRGIAIALRHHTELRNLLITGAKIGVWERDAWLSRRYNCRVQDCATGWLLRGSNHSSHWDGCSITNCRDIHLEIGAEGSARDGNLALLFSACDIEFGNGIGIDVAEGAAVTFESCYLGEGIASEILRNRGRVTIRGGTLQFGMTAKAIAVRPLAGLVVIENSVVSGQTFGALGRLIDRVPAANAKSAGRVRFTDIVGNFMVGGDVVLRGDVLGEGQAHNRVARYGAGWRPVSNEASVSSGPTADLPSHARRVVCTGATGPRPQIGLQGTIQDTVMLAALPLYFVLVYRASKPVALHMSDGAFSNSPKTLIGTLPASEQLSTYVKVDIVAPSRNYSAIDAVLEAVPGDFFELHRAGMTDGSFTRSTGSGALSNLALI